MTVASRITATVSENPVCCHGSNAKCLSCITHETKRLTKFGQTLSTTIFLSNLSANSGNASSNAILVPLSGLSKSITTGSRTTLLYSSGGTFFPSWMTSGRMEEAEVASAGTPSDERREGRMRWVENVGGRAGATSLIVLQNQGQLFCGLSTRERPSTVEEQVVRPRP